VQRVAKARRQLADPEREMGSTADHPSVRTGNVATATGNCAHGAGRLGGGRAGHSGGEPSRLAQA
jgi:hypothetical protein